MISHQVLEFMEDFASSLGLAASQRERLLQQLGVEDQELLEAKQLVTWLPPGDQRRQCHGKTVVYGAFSGENAWKCGWLAKDNDALPPVFVPFCCVFSCDNCDNTWHWWVKGVFLAGERCQLDSRWFGSLRRTNRFLPVKIVDAFDISWENLETELGFRNKNIFIYLVNTLFIGSPTTVHISGNEDLGFKKGNY